MINLVVCSLSALKCSEKSNKISEETIDLIARLNSEGIRFAVVTGMNYDAVSPLFGKIKKDIHDSERVCGEVRYQGNLIEYLGLLV